MNLKEMSKDTENLYNILKLDQNCSTQAIKKSFILLSKQYHPDLNADKDSHSKFVKINEAYNILIKPNLRREYDNYLANNNHTAGGKRFHHYYENIQTTRNDAAYWASRANGVNEPYYGVKGLKKVSNSAIVLICLAWAAVGAGIQFFVINKSYTFDRDQLMRDSARNQIMYEYSKNQAETKGNDKQINDFWNDTLRNMSKREGNVEYTRRLQETTAESEEKLNV